MDLLDYDLTSSLLDIKKKQLGQKDKMSSPLANIPNGIFSANTFGLGGTCVPKGIFAIGGDLQTNGADYKLGQIYEVTEEEANRLKAMGYGFTVVS